MYSVKCHSNVAKKDYCIKLILKCAPWTMSHRCLVFYEFETRISRSLSMTGIDSVLFYNGESHILSSPSLPAGYSHPLPFSGFGWRMPQHLLPCSSTSVRFDIIRCFQDKSKFTELNVNKFMYNICVHSSNYRLGLGPNRVYFSLIYINIRYTVQ